MEKTGWLPKPAWAEKNAQRNKEALPSIAEFDHREPPHTLEAEQAVLGALLLYTDIVQQVLPVLQTADFFFERHQKVYEIIRTLESESLPIDVISVADRLDVRGYLDEIGGLPYLSELADRLPTTANILHYAVRIREKSTLRKLIHASKEILADAFNEVEDVAAFLDSSERKIFEIRGDRDKRDVTHVKDIIRDSFKMIESLYNRKDLVTGTPTGFEEFDRLSSGLQPSDLVILAGRPSMGKTSLAMNMVANAAILHKVPCIVFSLEMSKEQLITRMLCSHARVSQSRLRTGMMNEQDIPRLTRAASDLGVAPIYIDDSGNVSLLEMRSKCRRLRGEFDKIGLIVVDYLQLMRGESKENREREISEISRGLKSLAKELHAPVLALSQLNRSLERRPDKRPMMSDLRESGAIEQDADMIAFVYRDEVYHADTAEKGIAEIIIGKQRNGPIGTAKVRFINEITRFENLDASGDD